MSSARRPEQSKIKGVEEELTNVLTFECRGGRRKPNPRGEATAHLNALNQHKYALAVIKLTNTNIYY